MKLFGFRSQRLRAAFALGVACVAACTSDKIVPATQLVVEIDSDLEVGKQLTAVDVQVLDRRGKQGDDYRFKIVKDKPGKNEVTVPFTFGVAKGADNQAQLVVTGYGPKSNDDDVAVVKSTVNVAFQSQKTLELTVWLRARCLGELCDEDTSCDPERTQNRCAAIPDADMKVRTSSSKDAGVDDRDAASPRAGKGGSSAGTGGSGGSAAGSGGRAGSAAGAGGAAAGGGGAAGTAAGAGGSGSMCTPNCAGKKCGPDGCNGNCGSCANSEKCDNGTCMCVPNCSGKRCGPDGCGGSCGMCAGNDKCEGGTCVCSPNCTGKQCGPDGCGGQCSPGCNAQFLTCVSGVCKGACGAVYEACNCEVAPSQTPGSMRVEPACANGFAVLQACSAYCYDPDTGVPVSQQWGESCGCD